MLQQLPTAEPSHPALPKPTHAPWAARCAQTLPTWDLDSSSPECLWALCSGSSKLWLLSPAELNTHPCAASGSGSGRDRAGLEIEPRVLVRPRRQSRAEAHTAMLTLLLRHPNLPRLIHQQQNIFKGRRDETLKRQKKCSFFFYKAGQKDGGRKIRRD